jgi:Tfp pilus assembly protein PilW
MIELLVTMVIMGVVLGGLTTIFVSGSKAENDMNVRFQAQQQARLALDRVRRDAHAAGCATIGGGGSNVQLLLPSSTGTCPGATLYSYYCTAASTQLSGAYALYRALTVIGTCSTAGGGTLVADYLTTNVLFTTPSSTGQQLGKLGVDFSVDASTNTTGGVYELKDEIVLRNSPRSAT